MTENRTGTRDRRQHYEDQLVLAQALDRVRVLQDALAGLYGLLQLYETRLPYDWKYNHRAVAARAALEPPNNATGQANSLSGVLTVEGLVPDTVTPAPAAPLTAHAATQSASYERLKPAEYGAGTVAAAPIEPMTIFPTSHKQRVEADDWPAPAATEWKWVPREPTPEMYAAAEREWDGRMSARSAGVWQAMYAAAPPDDANEYVIEGGS